MSNWYKAACFLVVSIFVPASFAAQKGDGSNRVIIDNVNILLINGNPLEDISILTDPEQNLALTMKDGNIYKNTMD